MQVTKELLPVYQLREKVNTEKENWGFTIWEYATS